MVPFDRQLQRHIPALRRYARSLLHHGGQADDLVQDCLMRALERQQLWQPDSDLRAWLFTVMHNVYVNQIRKLQRQPVSVTLIDELAVADEVVADEVAPDQLARNQHLQRQMSRLPFPQREVLALVALEGFSYQQVAEILAIPIGTVMSRLNRARESMRQWLYSDVATGLRRVK